ncbi:MAG: hypothetical protein KDC05_06245 [Bacteroidales bacterium]|nr:hypothetical protein [Bacteroidales bacterium]
MQGNKQKKTTLGLVASFQRQIKSGDQYDKLFPKPDFSDTLLQEGNVNDTVFLMGEYIQKYKSDTAKLAPILKGKSLEETLRNNWNFVYNHIQYKLDTPGIEELRRPARTWAERKSGVDCDCYTIFLCTLLLNQGIEPVIRIVQIPPATSFHHVYPIVYKNKKSGEYYTLDVVLDRFNYEKPFSKKRDYTMDELGIPIKGLHGIPHNKSLICLANVCSDNLGSTDDRVYARLVATRDIIAEYPTSVAPFENPKRFLEELNYAIDNWHTPNRDQALKILAQREKQLDEIEPLNGPIDNIGDDLENMTDDQVEAMVDLLSGAYDSFEEIETGEDLGRVLLAKDKRLREKQFRLNRKLKSSPRRNHRNISRRIRSISRLRSRINQVNTLDQRGKSKLARVIKQTYAEKPNYIQPKIQEEKVSDPINQLPETNILPIEQPIPEVKQPEQDFIYLEDFAESYPEPEMDYPETPTDYIDISPVEENYGTYENDPYDDWLELMEDYLDDMEDLEDDISLAELEELNGLGAAELGAFWHKRKKRLELKQKRQEKRLKKAEKKGKTNRVKRLTAKLEKNKIKQEDAGKWKKVRKQWRKDNKRGFWQGVQKAGQGAINAIVKFNPLSIAVRNGFLAALKLNVKKMSSRLKWGYATKEQALKHGMTMARWLHTKKALEKVEKLFVDKTKGSKEALKNAIIKGGKGLNGIELDGLGAAPIAAVAAAATPLIIAVVKILQNSGLMDPAVKIEKVEEDIKKGDLKNNTDIPPSEFDEVELDIEKSWYQNRGVKIAGIAGGGLILLGLGYMAYNKKQKHNSHPVKKSVGSLSGNSQEKPTRTRSQKATKTKEEPIKEITLT